VKGSTPTSRRIFNEREVIIHLDLKKKRLILPMNIRDRASCSSLIDHDVKLKGPPKEEGGSHRSHAESMKGEGEKGLDAVRPGGLSFHNHNQRKKGRKRYC